MYICNNKFNCLYIQLITKSLKRWLFVLCSEKTWKLWTVFGPTNMETVDCPRPEIQKNHQAIKNHFDIPAAQGMTTKCKECKSKNTPSNSLT